jgi:hypothetical protein
MNDKQRISELRDALMALLAEDDLREEGRLSDLTIANVMKTRRLIARTILAETAHKTTKGE